MHLWVWKILHTTCTSPNSEMEVGGTGANLTEKGVRGGAPEQPSYPNKGNPSSVWVLPQR